jgi:hypothetical protein
MTQLMSAVWTAELAEIALSGFLTEGFLKDTGPAGNIAFFTVGLTYKF